MPVIAHIGSVVTVTPSDEIQVVSGPGKHEFIADRSPFAMKVSGFIEEKGKIIGVYGDVVSGHERYRGLIATLLTRLDNSDWTRDNHSAAGFKVGRNPARPNGKHAVSHPDGTDIDGFPYILRFGSIDSRIGSERLINSANEAFQESQHAFTQRLAQRIEQPEPNKIADSLADCVEVMRMWRFFGGDPAGSAVVGPFSEQTQFPWVGAEDVDRLQRALVTFIRNYPHHPQLCSAVHALCYLAAPETKSLLIRVLRDCLGRDSSALYQTILALEALGDNLYGLRSSTSCNEVERNEQVAREYLSSQPDSS